MKYCLVQRSKSSQFYFSSAQSEPLQDLPKIKIHPIPSIPLKDQPTLGKVAKVSKRTTKKESIFCSFAPIETSEGEFVPCKVDYVFDGRPMKGDVLFDIDMNDSLPIEKNVSIIDVNTALLGQLSDLKEQNTLFGTEKSQMEEGLMKLLEQNLCQLVTTKLYSKKQIRDCMKRIKMYDSCYKGVLSDTKCLSSNSLGLDSL